MISSTGNAGPVTTIWAFRHGETDANKTKSLSGAAAVGPKFDINEKGRQQAEALAGQVAKKCLDLKVIYSSDLQRAIDTANIVAGAYQPNQIEIILKPQLREIFHGAFEGGPDGPRNAEGDRLCAAVPGKPISDRFCHWRIHPLTRKVVGDDVAVRDIAKAIKGKDPRPETVLELYKRAESVFSQLAEKHPGQTIGVSAHGGILGTLAEALRFKDKDVVLPPYYTKASHIKACGEVLMPAATKVGNCALLCFRYHHGSKRLELV